MATLHNLAKKLPSITLQIAVMRCYQNHNLQRKSLLKYSLKAKVKIRKPLLDLMHLDFFRRNRKSISQKILILELVIARFCLLLVSAVAFPFAQELIS